MIKVSVIMLSYNHAKFIMDAIESVLAQTIQNLELIIIDDGSVDDSQKVIRDFQKKDNRVREFLNTENKGISIRRNEGLKLSKGQYIAFIDADDVWLKDKLERQLKVLEEDESGIIWTEGEIIDAKGNPTGETVTKLHKATERKKSGNIFNELLETNFILISSFIIAKKNLKNITFCEDLKYMQDWLLFAELAKDYQFYFIEIPLAKYRIHGNNTNCDKYGYLLDVIKVNKLFIKKFRDILNKENKSKLYFKLAILSKKLDRKIMSEFYALRALFMDPLNLNAKYYLTNRLKNSFPLFYRVTRTLWQVLISCVNCGRC